METSEEKKNRHKSFYLSLGIHGALLILFFFLLAWKEPFPPIPQYGIELNFGIDNQGSGTLQRQAPPTPTPSEEVTEASEQQQPNEITPEDQAEEVLTEPEDTESVQEEVDPENVESPDVVKEVTGDQGKNDAEQVSEVTDSPAQPVEASESEDDTSPGGINQGDDNDEVGDKGTPEGKIDKRALYGNPGAGGGASLDMAGWMWDYLPSPDDRSDESGRIVFSITIDDRGEILSIRTLEKTVTPAVERIYRAEVEKLTFSTTSDNTLPAATSTGTITFIIKSN